MIVKSLILSLYLLKYAIKGRKTQNDTLIFSKIFKRKKNDNLPIEIIHPRNQ